MKKKVPVLRHSTQKTPLWGSIAKSEGKKDCNSYPQLLMRACFTHYIHM